jgi:hypothetical protein
LNLRHVGLISRADVSPKRSLQPDSSGELGHLFRKRDFCNGGKPVLPGCRWSGRLLNVSDGVTPIVVSHENNLFSMRDDRWEISPAEDNSISWWRRK